MRITTRILSVIAACGILFTATACSSNKTSSVSSNPSNPDLPNVTLANKNLVIYTGLGVDEKSLRSAIPGAPDETDLFIDHYQGKITFINVDWNEYYTKLMALYMADNMPDLLWPMPDSFPTDINNNLIAPFDGLQPYIDLSSPIWDSTRQYNDKYVINGKHYYAISEFGAPAVICYNPKIFQLNDVEEPLDIYNKNPGDWTWDKMLDLAKQLTLDTNGDGKIDQWGFGVSGDGPTCFQESTGVPLIDYSNNTITNNLTNPAIADAANFYRDLGPAKYNVLDPAINTDDYKNFISGKDAMVSDAIWRVYGDYKDLWKQGKIAVVPFPKYPKADQFYSGRVLWSYHIANKAKNPQAAALWITLHQYISTKSYENYYGKGNADFKYRVYDTYNIPRSQADLLISINSDYTKFPVVDRNWIGWYGKGWYCGFSDLQSQTWASIVARVNPMFEKDIQKNLTTFNSANGANLKEGK